MTVPQSHARLNIHGFDPYFFVGEKKVFLSEGQTAAAAANSNIMVYGHMQEEAAAKIYDNLKPNELKVGKQWKIKIPASSIDTPIVCDQEGNIIPYRHQQLQEMLLGDSAGDRDELPKRPGKPRINTRACALVSRP
jgi:hypothetical protein